MKQRLHFLSEWFPNPKGYDPYNSLDTSFFGVPGSKRHLQAMLDDDEGL